MENPWWCAGKGIDDEEVAWPRRAYFSKFVDLAFKLPASRALVLAGPRRVGKTVMLKHLIHRLLQTESWVGTQIFFLSLDTPLYSGRSLESLVQLFVDLNLHPVSQPLWVLFDEVQYIKGWENELIPLVDSYPHIRFVVCSSVNTGPNRKKNESEPVHLIEFILPPLTFFEYLQFAGREGALIVDEADRDTGATTFQLPDIQGLNVEFVNYLNYGGFPETVMNPQGRANPARLLRQNVIRDVLFSDQPSLFGIGDTKELNRFFNVLAFNSGNEVGLEELSKHCGIAKSRITAYLEYLEAAFLIRRVLRVDDKGLRLLRERTFKVVLINPSMRAALFGPLTANDDAMTKLAEAAIWSQWMHSPQVSRSLHCASWKEGRQNLDVSIVSLDFRTHKPRFTVDINWHDKIPTTVSELRGLHALASKNVLSRTPLVTTRTFTGNITLDGFEIEFMPLALHCFTIGRKLLRGS